LTANLPETRFSGPSLTLYDGGIDDPLTIPRTLAKDLIITDAGGKTTLAAVAGTIAHTIGGTAEQFVFSGATASNSKILAGGVESIYSGATAAHTTIAGGELLVQIGGKLSSGVTFNSTKGGDLVIDSATMPTATISGFIAGDTITLAGVTYNASDKVTVGTAGTVTISTPGINYKLDIAGATVGETDFKFSTGSVLTRSTAMQPLTFIAAIAAPNTVAPADDVFRSVELHHLAPASYSFRAHWLAPASPSLPGMLAADLHDRASINLPSLALHQAAFG
jgi:autotransporter passenger strand-loop-strand repeat protein